MTRARLVNEETPGSGEAARLGASAKYHPGCYEAARERDPESLPALG